MRIENTTLGMTDAQSAIRNSQSAMSLYDPLIERDVDAIRTSLRDFRAEHSSDDLFLAVARFAVVAYSPSLHGKHAVLCCLAAHDVRDELGDRFDDVLVECAIYAALARQPWSEPPILEPPAIDSNQPVDSGELRLAIRNRDRLRAERWLAARLDDDRLRRDYFRVACDDFEDLGHKLIMAVAAWRLSTILGEKGRFAALRVGIWEMAASPGGEPYRERGEVVDFQPLVDTLVDHAVAEHGSLVRAPRSVSSRRCLRSGVDRGRPRHRLARSRLPHGRDRAGPGAVRARGSSGLTSPAPPSYTLGRDCGACLIARAVGKRLAERFPGVDVAPMLAAAA